jgi:hypothetical protein
MDIDLQKFVSLPYDWIFILAIILGGLGVVGFPRMFLGVLRGKWLTILIFSGVYFFVRTEFPNMPFHEVIVLVLFCSAVLNFALNWMFSSNKGQ